MTSRASGEPTCEEMLELLREELRQELRHRWSDLAEACRSAIVQSLNPADERSGWSIQMLYIADRIADLTPLVGSPSWKEIQVELLLDGWWDAVHRRMGMEPPPFDRARAQEIVDQRRVDGPL